jgi:CheY-like chemotaxis protein
MAAERILIVDDEEAIREVVYSMLSMAGYQCRQAVSGLEALSILQTEEFELMLSDLMMPELDGIGLLERAKEKYPDMPVLMSDVSEHRLLNAKYGFGLTTKVEAHAIAQALTRIALDESLRLRLSEGSRQLALQSAWEHEMD